MRRLALIRTLTPTLVVALAAGSLGAAEPLDERLRAWAERLDHPPGNSLAYDQGAEEALVDPQSAAGERERLNGRWATASVGLATMLWEWRHQRHGWGVPQGDRSAAIEHWSQPILISPTLPYAPLATVVAEDPAAGALDAMLCSSFAVTMTRTAGGPGAGSALSTLPRIAERISAAGEPVILVNLAATGAAFMEVAWSWSFQRAAAPRLERLMDASWWSTAVVLPPSADGQALHVRRQNHVHMAEVTWMRFWRQWNRIFGISVPPVGWWRAMVALEIPVLVDAACTDVAATHHDRGSGGPLLRAAAAPAGADNGLAQVRQVQDLLRVGRMGTLVPYPAPAAPATLAFWRSLARLLVVERLLALDSASTGGDTGGLVDEAEVQGRSLSLLLASAYGDDGTVSRLAQDALRIVHRLIVHEALGHADALGGAWSGSLEQLRVELRSISSAAAPVRVALLMSLDHGDPVVIPGHEGFAWVCAQVALAVGLGTQAMAAGALVTGEGAEQACGETLAWVAPLLHERPGAERTAYVRQTLRVLRRGLSAVVCDAPLIGTRQAQGVPGVDLPETRITDLTPSADEDVDGWARACTECLWPKLRAQDHRLFLGALAQEWARTEAATLLMANGMVDMLMEASPERVPGSE